MMYIRIVFVIRMSAIGDVILAARSVVLLAHQGYYPVLVTSAEMEGLARKIEGLPAFICLDVPSSKNPAQFFLNQNKATLEQFTKHIQSLFVQKNAVVLDLQKTARSKRALSFIQQETNPKIERVFSVRKRTLYRFFLVSLSRFSFSQKKNVPLDVSKIIKIQRLQEDLIKKMMKRDGKDFSFLEKEKSFLKKKDVIVAQKYVCLFPGASGFIKMWPKEHFRTLIYLILEQTDFHIKVCGSDKEKYLGEYLCFPQSSRLHNLVGTTDLSHTLDLISQASYVVSNDSFAAHAADAFAVPASVIFGSTSPKFGFISNSDKMNIEYENLSCSPCTRHGQGTCRFQNLKCLREITPQQIFQHLFKMTQLQGATRND